MVQKPKIPNNLKKSLFSTTKKNFEEKKILPKKKSLFQKYENLKNSQKNTFFQKKTI